jgi:hypothetical protein
MIVHLEDETLFTSIRMSIPKQLALHIRQVHMGGNWTASNLKDALDGVSWRQAVEKRDDRNSIAVILYHMHYYVKAIAKVMEGGPLDASDRFSFDLPPIESDADWEGLKAAAFQDAERLAVLVEALSDQQIMADFDDGKYGNVLRNILGLIEHTHYHLGQIVLLRKDLRVE